MLQDCLGPVQRTLFGYSERGLVGYIPTLILVVGDIPIVSFGNSPDADQGKLRVGK